MEPRQENQARVEGGHAVTRARRDGAHLSTGSLLPRHVLGDIAEDHVRRDWRNLIQSRLLEFALDVAIMRETEPVMRLQTDIRRLPGRVGTWLQISKSTS
jgi:hypothetical protein